MKLFTHIFITLFVLGGLFCPDNAAAVESSEFAITLQGGGISFDGKLGDLFASDLAYGVGFAWGFSDYFAIVFDILYSEHQQSDEDEYGDLSLTHGIAAPGARGAYTFRHFMPYIEAAPLAAFTSYEATFDAGDESDEDSLDSHGFGIMGTLGCDVFIADGATLGLAGRLGVAQTDMNFATGADVDNEIDVYTFYSGLVRLSLLF